MGISRTQVESLPPVREGGSCVISLSGLGLHVSGGQAWFKPG